MSSPKLYDTIGATYTVTLGSAGDPVPRAPAGTAGNVTFLPVKPSAPSVRR